MTLKQLIIQNILLVEETTLDFAKGFTVLSGETGSGKSAILDAIGLVAGDKFDVSHLRRGSTKASVTALFAPKQAEVWQFLNECGIDYEPSEPLVVKREVSPQKSRCFVNQQPVQLSFLKKLGELLFERVDQHATHQLRQPHTALEWLDLFADLVPMQLEAATLYKTLKQKEAAWAFFQENTRERERQKVSLERELEEIANAKLVEGEEEELFKEFSFLHGRQERLEAIQSILQGLSLTSLQKSKTPFERLVHLDPSSEELFASYQNAYLELVELS